MTPSKKAKIIGWSGLSIGLTLMGASYGVDRSEKNVAPTPERIELSAVDAACASPVFSLGRPISEDDLRLGAQATLSIESVQFRDVISKSADEVELAYRVETKMQKGDGFVEPVSSVVCHEGEKKSARAKKLSRTTVPVMGDLHLPSTRITIYDVVSGRRGDDRDRLYNFARLWDMSVSDGGYFSLTPITGKRQQRVQSLDQYLELLRNDALYSRVEVREISQERLAIYAEKEFAGEKAQLLITLVESHR
jgi:hypothetical protein